jgi:hypothetical protein
MEEPATGDHERRLAEEPHRGFVIRSGAMSRLGAVIVLLCSLGATARADDGTGTLAPAPADDGDDSEPRLITPTGHEEAVGPRKDHYHQFGAALQIPIGVRAIVPYDKQWCGDRGDNQNVNAEACIDRMPFTLGFVFAYGVTHKLEALLEMRFGLERDFGMSSNANSDGPHIFQWSPGVKLYFSEAGRTKLFSTAQIAFDHTGYQQEDVTDFFLRNENGLQLDLDPSYGLYFFFGEEMAFRRWFDVDVEAGLGIQGRYP